MRNPTFMILFWATNIAFVMLCAALILAFGRLLRGPSVPDRVVALDLIAALVIGTIATYDIATNDTVFLDVAIALGLVAFLGTVAFAHYIERGASRRETLHQREQQSDDK